MDILPICFAISKFHYSDTLQKLYGYKIKVSSVERNLNLQYCFHTREFKERALWNVLIVFGW